MVSHAKQLSWGFFPKASETQFLSKLRHTKLKDVSKNFFLKQTGLEPAPSVGYTPASSRFSVSSRASGSSRPFKAFSTQMAATCGGPCDTRRSNRLQTRVYLTTESGMHSKTQQFSQ